MKGSTTRRRMHWNKSITIIARVLLSNSQSIITQRIKSSDFIRWCFFFKREKKDICVCVKEDLFFLSYPGRMLSSHWTNRQKTRRKKKRRKELNTYPYKRANASVQQVHRPSLFSPLFFFFFTTFDDWTDRQSSDIYIAYT